MLEYSLEDAKALLEKNHDTATKNLAQVHHDLDFLRLDSFSFTLSSISTFDAHFIDRDQMTTTEVNMARLYNWDVKRRQALNAKS